MGEVSAQIYLQEKEDGLGWTYTKWLVNLGKGDGLLQEDVSVKCSETSQRYMSQHEAAEEAKSRIAVKIKKECGDYPEDEIRWVVTEAKMYSANEKCEVRDCWVTRR